MAQVIDNKKCYNCGKVFRTPANLEAHKNRKTPCLIREVTPEIANNPNRCIFCNKVLSKQEHLIRHLRVCKVKNGGMEMLADKVRYEQELRIIREQQAARDEEFRQMREQMNKQKEEIEQLRKQIVVTPANNTVNNINNTVNNNTVNNFVINYYTHPDTVNLIISVDDIDHADKISTLIFEKIYFNRERPQNHCLYMMNKKTRELLIHDDDKKNWKIVSGENIRGVMNSISNVVRVEGDRLINSRGAPGDDATFLTLPPPVQHKIIEFNTNGEALSQADAYDVLTCNRDFVAETIRATGCQLLR